MISDLFAANGVIDVLVESLEKYGKDNDLFILISRSLKRCLLTKESHLRFVRNNGMKTILQLLYNVNITDIHHYAYDIVNLVIQTSI